METIRFLNVKEGDCSIIQHPSGRVSVIDVCNAKPPDSVSAAIEELAKMMVDKAPGNFNQKAHPVNPIAYLNDHSIKSIFRYIQTHPDMDHMDGIKCFFETFSPINFWDTDNKKELAASDWGGSPYNAEDWKFYKNLRDSKPKSNPIRITNLSGDKGQYWNKNADGTSGGDGIHILAPTQELVDAANAKDDDYNDCSYVLLYRTGNHRVVFGGDSHDASWEHILTNHKTSVTNIDLLIAPHHGRKSGRSYKFLDVLKPKLTFFGNAPSQHLAYNAWNNRNLPFVTNNQANCMVVDTSTNPMGFYVTNETYAKKRNPQSLYHIDLKAWYVCSIN